jgi:nitronate monooxygenase
MWPDRRLIDLFGIELPFVQAPMAGAMDHELAAAAAEAGALGTLPCAMLSEAQVREQSAKFRALTKKPLGLAFFCHVVPVPNNEREARWRDRLAPYYREFAIDRVEKGLGCRMDTKRKILEALGLSLADRVRVFGEEE